MAKLADLTNPDTWQDVPDSVLSEIQRQSEMMVKETVKLGIAADYRATTTMNIFGAGAIALIAAAATLVASKADWILAFAPAITAVFLFVAAGCCARACAPVLFMLPGARPTNLIESNIDDERSFRVALLLLYEQAAENNTNKIWRNTNWFGFSLFAAAAGAIMGIGTTLIWASRF